MTRLRKMMLEELQRRNYAETTIDCYIRVVEDFSRHFNCSPDRLGPRHIREYQAALFQKRKFSPNTVAQHLAALRFFYVKTLKKAWSITETPYPKKAVHLPTILSQEEVAQLIDAAHPPLHRTLLMTLYATGLRRAELARLKVSDVDSQRMVIHVQGGKGRKDRDVLLSPKLLDELKRHWRRLTSATRGTTLEYRSLSLKSASVVCSYGDGLQPTNREDSLGVVLARLSTVRDVDRCHRRVRGLAYLESVQPRHRNSVSNNSRAEHKIDFPIIRNSTINH